MSAGDMSDEMMLGMMQTTTLEKQRCIYEDENILVEHSFATFGSGAKEAVLAVHTKSNGLIWQTETGATNLIAPNFCSKTHKDLPRILLEV